MKLRAEMVVDVDREELAALLGFPESTIVDIGETMGGYAIRLRRRDPKDGRLPSQGASP